MTGIQEIVKIDVQAPLSSLEVRNDCRLLSKSLRRLCSIDHFEFTTTEELPYVRDIIGQPRGVRALEFGLDIDGPGYNVFLLGPTGTGRATTVKRFLERRAEAGEVSHDWAYVHNFRAPHKPRVLLLPAGAGARLREAMAGLVEDLRNQIPLVLNTKEFKQAIDEIERDLKQRRAVIMEKVFTQAADRQLAVVRTSEGLAVVPTSDGQPIALEDITNLPEAQRKDVDEHRLAIEKQVEEAIRLVRVAEWETAQTKRKLKSEVINALLDLRIPDIRGLCANNQKAMQWLDEVRQDILDSLDAFAPNPEEIIESTADLPTVLARAQQEHNIDGKFRRYKVNLIVDHSNSKGSPVVLVDLPTLRNMIGYIGSEIRTGGAMKVDFTMINPGALHLANGGHLVVDAMSILKQPLAWEAFKRALRSSEVRIEDPESLNGVGVLRPQIPEPEPIPLSIKVVMLGTSQIYYSLQSTDDEFPEMFKVKADFAATMERTHKNEHQYALFIAARCHEGNLLPFDPTGVAKIVEFGSRLAEDKTKLSTRFGDISDLVHEAAHWARSEGKNLVSARDVTHAIEDRIYRANLTEEDIRQKILEGTLLIDTEGEADGQVNGLTVLQLGDYTFGQPHRVTARAFLGNDGVINIEREVEMAGPIHNKGLLTLRGYMGGQYALEHPLSLSASVAFEQIYSGVEGDSASSTELYALLSALSNYPIRQDIAVTGSVNQFGQLQPIGAVTQKIEGFYEVCKARGLTGTQGVIIPASNVKNLMMKEEVMRVVEEGKFHIYAVETINQGIEILTGVTAGERGQDGTFLDETVHHAVCTHLQDMADSLEHYGSYRRV